MTALPSTEASVSSFPTLHLRMLVGRRHAPVFPFDQRQITYYYLARNGIHALANAWKLAGQEVLVPAYCHGVEIQALLHAGVRPRYYPVRSGMKVFAQDVISNITPQTRAVYLIHYLGFPGPVEELSAFCRAHDLLLIEDCALALLSKAGSQPLGSFGDAAVFCLYKTLPVPNGGAVVVREGLDDLPTQTSTPSLASTLSYTASAMLRRGPVRHGHGAAGSGESHWLDGARERVKPFMEKVGMVKIATETFDVKNARLGMSALCHTVIANQNFGDIIARRRRNYAQLASRLTGIADLVRPDLPEGVCPLFVPVRTPQKIALCEQLVASGVDAVNFWWFAAPGLSAGEFPDVDDMRRTVIELPCHQDLTSEAIDWIADHVIRLRPYL